MIANRKSSVKQKSNKNNIVGSLDVIKTAGELSLQKGLDFDVVIKALESLSLIHISEPTRPY